MTVDEYLEAAPEPHRTNLTALRATLRQILPQADEMISYGMPTFKVKEKAVAGYAYFKNHCSYFPHSSGVLTALAGDLEGYRWSKGTLQFPPDRPLPPSLVRRLVETRLKELGLG